MTTIPETLLNELVSQGYGCKGYRSDLTDWDNRGNNMKPEDTVKWVKSIKQTKL